MAGLHEFFYYWKLTSVSQQGEGCVDDLFLQIRTIGKPQWKTQRSVHEKSPRWFYGLGYFFEQADSDGRNPALLYDTLNQSDGLIAGGSHWR
ncbi:MAG: hypothetical protein ACWGQW_14870 [bacterium]